MKLKIYFATEKHERVRFILIKIFKLRVEIILKLD